MNYPDRRITEALPVRRSLNTGYVGRLSNWSGTPRCIAELRDDDVESRWWWSHAFAACLGATLVLAAVIL